MHSIAVKRWMTGRRIRILWMTFKGIPLEFLPERTGSVAWSYLFDRLKFGRPACRAGPPYV
jgi:hypothetical protein